MKESERRRALNTLQAVYDDLAERALETVLENEEGLRQGPYSFAYQELEDRFVPRLISLGHALGSLQQGSRPPPRPPKFHVVRVEAPLRELDQRINEALDAARGALLHGVQLAQDDEDGGLWHAFITLARPR